MGITASSASFRGDPPSLKAIVAEIERVSGLALVVESRSSGDQLLFSAEIAFDCVRRERVTVHAYAPGRKGMRELIMATSGMDALLRDNPKVAKMLEACMPAATPDPSIGHVHTMGYIGEEGTLHDFAAIVDAQSGPFALTSLPSVESRRLEQSLAGYELDAPALAETSASLWRAGVFPTFAEYLVEDEWSYLIGLDDRVVSVVPIAEALVHERVLSQQFFAVVGKSAEILLIEIERRRWEVYSRHTAVLEELSRVVSVDVVEADDWQHPGG